MSTCHFAIESLLRDTGADGTCTWQALGRSVGGSAWRVVCGDSAWFVKQRSGALDLFRAEADGLQALADCDAVRVPRVLATGEQGDVSFLVLEWLDLVTNNSSAASRLGSALARQHHCTGKHFGWRCNNFIGATPQFNTTSDDWVHFLRDHRLGFQLRLAAENGFRGGLQVIGARLLEKLPVFFEGYTPAPSLLHGDLWGGNWGALDGGEPVIFDPAVYYGDREADLAMTELFGDFPGEFYSAYSAASPLDDGYPTRRDIYKLYHLLNHLNLFGGSYLAQAQNLIEQLLARS